MTERRLTRQVMVGGIAVGGEAPVSVQSMTNTDTRDIAATVGQALALEQAGCQIIRVAIFDQDCLPAISAIKQRTGVPLVADIHFSAKLAIDSVEAGVDKLRINPGNIGGAHKVAELVRCVRERQIPIRIGVNAGSLERHLLEQFGGPTPEAMVQSALSHVRILEDAGYDRILVSLKASSVPDTVAACRLFSRHSDYPLHLGVTEAGTPRMGIVKSAVGIGGLLLEGIGDTLRVSLTGDPAREVRVGWDILRSCGLHKQGMEIISCPTCGRCRIDVESIVNEIEARLGRVDVPIQVAVMGCVVNGPGEASHADIGIAGGLENGVLFKKGQRIGTVKAGEMVNVLVSEIRMMIAEKIDDKSGR